MSPAANAAGALVTSFPRVSGDEPTETTDNATAEEFSPRERG